MMRKITQERFVFDLPVHGGTAIEFMDPDVVEYMRRVFEDAERYRHLCETSPYDLCFSGQTFRSKQDLDAAIDAAMKQEGER